MKCNRKGAGLDRGILFCSRERSGRWGRRAAGLFAAVGYFEGYIEALAELRPTPSRQRSATLRTICAVDDEEKRRRRYG